MYRTKDPEVKIVSRILDLLEKRKGLQEHLELIDDEDTIAKMKTEIYMLTFRIQELKEALSFLSIAPKFKREELEAFC